jgi:hypothetical protein
MWALWLFVLACGDNNQALPPTSALPTSTLLPVFISETPKVTATLTPSITPTPSDTATPTLTATPITPTATATLTPTPPIVKRVISNQNVNIRAEASFNSRVLASVEPGTQVETHYASPDGQWVFVRLVNEEGELIEGWINRPLLELGDYIPPTQGPTPTPSPEVTQNPTGAADGTQAPFVTVTPSGSATPQAAVTPGEGLSQQNVLAYCRTVNVSPPRIRADQTVSIWWSWFVARQDLMDDHLQNARYEVLLDGRLLSDYARYQTPMRRESDGNWYVYWYVPVGTLTPGRHEVSYRLTWENPVNDGYESFGPGTANEANTGNCVFTVSE